ncbi:acyltransferase [Paenibacillus sp. SC116]|uniref:acyltransferase family protein n=1 Tax=Paenibacillus sp. SC116 TaxID=2968986 RepID=UPI00215ACB33|nr:acyltransferase [Paenibacillus sp. SC116]MCR8843055.1 acyltransferase [Paenibacillus sp. SC116]
MQTQLKSQLGWIDFLKGLSILAVVVDHMYGILYVSREFHLFTVFSVTLFIFLAGVTSVISLDRNKLAFKDYLIKRTKGILIPFIVASIIYSIINHNYYFNLSVFWNELIMFKASPPFYFVLFYCQLILISPVLYKILNKSGILLKLSSLIPLYFISKYLTHYTEISGIYGGGGRVLGGSYLFVFYLGMMLFMIYKKYGDSINRLWIHLLGIASSISAIYLLYVSGWLNLGWSNPPNKQTIIYTCSVLLFGYSLYMILHKSKILSLFSIMGKYSLYIFLYHMLAMFYASKVLLVSGLINNALLKSVIFISFAIVIPLAIGYLTKNRLKIVKKISIVWARKSPPVDDANTNKVIAG